MIYAVGMDLVVLETASSFLLLICVVPLAVTMTVFLLWIMYGLTGWSPSAISSVRRHSLADVFPCRYHRRVSCQEAEVQVGHVQEALSRSDGRRGRVIRLLRRFEHELLQSV